MSDEQGLNLSAGFLVGRDKELATFLETFDEVIDGKGARVLAVSGEAGVGKTRLVGEFLELYEGPGAWVLKGRCLFQERETPYRPFIDILQEYRTKAKAKVNKTKRKLKAKGHDKSKVKTKDLASIMPEDALEKASIDELLDKAMALKDKLTSMESEGELKEEREWMFSNITQTIKDMARKDPVILFLDDMHWADMATVQLLDYIIHKTSDDRVMFVLAFRSEDVWETASGEKVMDLLGRIKGEKLLTEIPVKPLDRKSTQEMSQFFLRIPRLPDEFISKLYKETEGNPYFIEEVLKGLVNQDMVRIGDIASIESLDMRAVGIPTTLSDAVLARVEALGPDRKKILQAASVIGDVFQLDILTDVLVQEKVDKDVLAETIDRFVMEHLIDVAPGAEKGSYVFKHNIIQAVIYESISRGRQRLLHKEVATSIEKLVKKMSPRIVYALANHFAIGHVPEKATVYNTMAGDKASSMYALDEAIYFYTQALDFLELSQELKNIEDRRMVLLLKIGDLYRFTGRWDMALEFYSQLETTAKENGDIGMNGLAVRKKGHIERYRGNWDIAETYLKEALTIAKKDKDELAIADCERGLGYVNWRKGEYEQSINLLRESLKLSEKVGDYFITGRNYIELGNVFSEMGEYEMAEKYFKRAIGYLEGINERLALARVYNNLGVLKGRTGEYKQSIGYLSESIDLYEQLGRPFFIWRTWCNIAHGCAKLGRVKESQKALSRAEQILRGTDDLMGLGSLQLEYGVLYSAMEDYDRAETFFVKALDIFTKMGMRVNEAVVHEELGRLYSLQEDTERAKDHLLVAEEIYSNVKAVGNVKKIKGMLKILNNDGTLPP